MNCCGKVLTGAVGLTKAALQISRASEQTVAARRDICRTCAHAEKRTVAGLVQVRLCNQCGCLIKAKSVIQTETCPLGLWPAIA